jgi:hypothetical protein
MKKRKTPYKHHVRGHKRAGFSVRSYERGKGDKPAPSRKARQKRFVPKETGKKKGKFEFYVTYVDGSKEFVDVDASSYPQALDAGFSARNSVKAASVVRLKRL